ncbi:MAG: hypothetical protein F4X56_07970 [Gammaproteobacteria bacterium]|nr:hypothetical protein [Gammaproteobacteria bacterium]MYC25836.1 hypothetical protein [Gammaproteobacteria bacterium]
MINLLKVFVSPGEVFESMREYIPSIPPLVTLLLCLCIFPALAAWYLSDEEYLRTIEASFDSSSEISNQFAVSFERTLLRGDRSDEEIEASLERLREMNAEQRKSLTSEDGIQSARRFQTVFGPLLAIFVYGLVVLLEATYFLIAGNMMQSSKQWSDWIGFTLWSMMPVVLYLLLSTLPTLWSGALDPYSWQAPISWIPGLETNVFALTLTIPTLWVVWIRVVGMHRWIEKPIPICFVVVLIPTFIAWLISAGSLQLANPYTM